MSAGTETLLPPDVRRLYPFEHRFMQVPGGHRLHYVDEGAGSPIVMVHGNPTWSFYFRNMISGLKGSHRCIAPDHVGCGLSDKPTKWGYRITDHVDNLVELIDRLDLHDVTLVVHDWGGPIGFLAALRRPYRFKRFVVLNSAAFLGPLPWTLTMLRLPGIGSFCVRRVNLLLRAGFARAVVRRDRLTPAVRAGYMLPYDSYANRKAVLRFIEEIPVNRNHNNRRLLDHLDAELCQFRFHPHLICWGLQDPVFHSGFLSSWRERVPDAEVHTFADASHWVLEDAGDRILPTMREFLGRTAQASVRVC